MTHAKEWARDIAHVAKELLLSCFSLWGQRITHITNNCWEKIPVSEKVKEWIEDAWLMVGLAVMWVQEKFRKED